MSDGSRRQFPLPGRGRPASGGVEPLEEPPGDNVGNITVPRDESNRTVALDAATINQFVLALQTATLAAAPKQTFGELAGRWFETIRLLRVDPSNERRHLAALAPLAQYTEDSLTTSLVEHTLATLRGLAASTRNKVRNTGRLVIRSAQADGKWSKPNPFDLAKRARETKRKYELLSVSELARVQEHLRPDRRRMFRVAVILGLRPGELLALRKCDVDERAGEITIRRSHERNETKTGRERVIPILPQVAGDLLEAIQESKSDLVFAAADGSQQRHDTKLTRALQTAMAAAGLVEGYEQKCRTLCGGPHVVTKEKDYRCKSCGRLCWPVPIVRPVRWYDLRHICATEHRRAGADPLAIALLLGHSVKGTTQAVYTHLSSSDLRRSLSSFVF